MNIEEISVGEYVRNREGRIDKVKNPDYYMSQYIECEKYLMSRASIVNHSKNIIDLIEVGDYVNGEKVSKITKNYITVGRITYGIKDLKGIKSIVTREQFENAEYVLKED